MNNIMFCSCGRRAQLFRFLKDSLGDSCQIIATDNQNTAPALYFADKGFTVPRIDSEDYLSRVLDIAVANDVKAITTLIDPEIELLAANRNLFLEKGIIPLCPSRETATYCFDKYKMFEYLVHNGIRTVLTYDSIKQFKEGFVQGDIKFPVFIKPRTGSGSVGIHKVADMETLEAYFAEGKFDYIIQEFMDCRDCDADVYVDCFSHEPVAIFAKNKLETKIGGASKTVSFKDEKLFEFVKDICKVLEFSGPVDMDFWYRNGEYYLSEINPRFGGAYLHAYGAGVDFFQLIKNNMEGKTNSSIIGQYNDDVLMMMYDSVVIVNKKDLVE